MQKPLVLTLAGALVLAGCGWKESRINPVNWFGRSEPVEVVAAEGTNPLIPEESRKRGVFSRPEAVDRSVLANQITDLQIEPTPTGAIIRATAVTSRQGAYDVELRRAGEATDGVLTLEFRVTFPQGPTPVGPAATRTVHAARSLSSQELAAIRIVRVNGATNARESRRR
ncbi:hypothetical protein AB9K35_05420 [Leisingera sp. XS_AS12]|uniref:hypothetical protein n=1 Tax=Leisingera sp. XS_AS12 TaxID=3241294 RepID=UPI003514C292